MLRFEAIEEFLSQRELALVGASRTGRKFGNTLLKELRAKGYAVVPVHPEAAEIDGVACVPSLANLPKPVGGLILVVKPTQAAQLVREAAAMGIPRIWMQQGSSSPEALRLCEELGIEAIHGECLLMFAAPTGIHRFHRWLWGLLGKLPPEAAHHRKDPS
jgi:predicted CoA-binding protein